MVQLTNKEIKKFLEETPLYKWTKFKKPKANRSSLWINEIDAFCDTCETVRPFQDLRNRGGGFGMTFEALSTGTSFLTFTCVSCRKDNHEYLVEQVISDDEIKIQKYGQLPRKKLGTDKSLQKFFSDDIGNYEKAVVCLSNGYGIAAFAYLRRIIEANVQKLIILLTEDIKSTDSNPGMLAALDELARKGTSMTEKITFANKALPEYLKPNGLNPLGQLYKVLSEGVHELSDEDCLEKANNVQDCLKYLINELSSRKVNRDQFSGKVGSL
jgi:hypothetical protein